MNVHSLKAMGSELEKLSADLTPEARSQISNKNFALTAKQSKTGKPAYPIHDERHARAALGFVGMHGTPQEKSEVYKDVARKYPHLAANSSVPALKSLAKTAGPASFLAKKLGPDSPTGKFIGEHHHGFDLAGLGVLAAPSAHTLYEQAKNKSQGKKVNSKDVFHGAAEIGGLGLLAAPVAAAALKGH